MKESIVITKKLGGKGVRQYKFVNARSYQTNPIAFFQMVVFLEGKRKFKDLISVFQ